ncbi:MAG: zinc ribbon domain-containing protein [Planctomycetota bacterium]
MSIEFTKNHQDLSTEKGFQFKFFCDKCGNGFLSEYVTNKLGVAGSLLNAAGSFFGGVFNQAGNSAHQIQKAVGGKQHDEAIRAAVAEMKPKFRHCTRCGKWVCPQACWNEKKSLCEDCAPDIGEELAAAQAQVAKDQVWDKARKADMVKDVDVERETVAKCASCGARTGTSKFCPECGKPVAVKTKCGGCGAEMDAAVKFCPECGIPRENKVKCGKCGALINTGTKFCPECGEKGSGQ